MLRPLAFVALLASCAAPPAPAPGAADAPSGADDRCWSTDPPPVVIEAARPTLRPLSRPVAHKAPDGAFETPCPSAYTSGFVASLQRALQVRGVYEGPVDGALGPELGRAVQAFQRPLGLDSSILSLEAARRLGLVALSREEIARL